MRDFFRPVATLLSGAALAQIVVYAARPLLTRLFTPQDFGALAFYAAVVAVVSSLATGKFEDALMLPAEEEKAWSLALAAIAGTAITALVIAVLIPFRQSLEGLLQSSAAIDLIAVAPLSVFLVGSARTFDSWLTRRKHFRYIAQGRVAYGFTMIPIQISSGQLGAGPAGLVGGLIGGQAIQSAYYYLRARAVARTARISGQGIGAVVAAARRYRRFPQFGAPAAALNTASVQLPALLLLFFFDASVLGQYGIAYATLAVPMTLLGASVAQVFYVRASEASRSGDLRGLTESIFERLAAIAAFPALVIITCGPELFGFVFGEAWTDAGVYAGYLAVWVYFVFISSPLSKLFDVMEMQRALLVFNVVLLVIRAGSLTIGGLIGNAGLAIGLFALAGAILWFIHTIWMMRIAEVSITRSLKTLGRFGAIAVVPVLVASTGKLMHADAIVAASSIIGAVLYYGVVYRLHPEYFSFTTAHAE